MAPSNRKSKEKKRTPKSGVPPRPVEERLAQAEVVLEMVLRASLRGRLLPSERKVIKAYIEERNAEKRRAREAKRETEGPRCPACRLIIPDEKAEHCPHCSVLLAVAKRSRSRRKL